MSRTRSSLVLAALSAVVLLAPLAHAAGTAAHAKPSATAKATLAPTSAPAAAPKATDHAAKPAHAKLAAMPKVDLNSATREELMKLPGIGDAIADKIIENRPFKAKSELMSKNLVNKAQYEKLAPHVIAKQPAAAR